MYNGRITEIGTVLVTGPSLTIEAPKTVGSLAVGGSVCVNGTCLSAVHVDIDAGRFRVEVSTETATRTTLTGSAVERFALAWSLPLMSIDELAAHL